ncbi:DUF167 domain-containing protein [Novosphingobium aerophilum]|uniref:DUF167 domain-containing protein n=1 Tax=Novosphingobium aerophilum TaxID=2839843 RepID=UPI001F3B468E|nr:DUF167 domain-containing protein [Novosphingobium aerophilum]
MALPRPDRPRPDRPPAAELRALCDAAGRLAVRVTPGARGEEIAVVDGRVLVKVRARPEGGKATEAVRNLLAEALDLPASRLELLRGATSREKLFRVRPG